MKVCQHEFGAEHKSVVGHDLIEWIDREMAGKGLDKEFNESTVHLVFCMVTINHAVNVMSCPFFSHLFFSLSYSSHVASLSPHDSEWVDG